LAKASPATQSMNHDSRGLIATRQKRSIRPVSRENQGGTSSYSAAAQNILKVFSLNSGRSAWRHCERRKLSAWVTVEPPASLQRSRRIIERVRKRTPLVYLD
jgi:hypothetical protein